MDYKINPEEAVLKTVKELDPDQQPREKAEKFGCGVLSVPELWALILRTGLTGLPITELCRNLMRDNENSLHRLERRSRQELRKIKGIGMTKSVQVEAVMELIKRYCQEDIPLDEPIVSSQQIFDRMKLRIGNLDHEEVWVLLLNRRNQVIKELRLTVGTGIASLFDVKMVLRHALLENAEGIILCHNHPSGGIQPSIQDRQITLDLKKGCDIMKLRMLDHLIVTPSRYYSFHDNGVI
ncbi:MAG: DNA repair protein RadC [Muribaculaceae bacterium]|nr:DNA repair protein RadC [Muribaculaceae bacterium]